jgi:hypothetical protein
LVRKKSALWLHPLWLCSPSARHPRPYPRSNFRSSPPQLYRAATLPRRRPGQLPLPPRPASLPSSLPATTRAHRQRRGAAAICPPIRAAAASPIRLPHPSATVAAPALRRSSAPPIQNVASSSVRHPRCRSRASSRSRSALAPSPLHAIRDRSAFLFYPYSAAPKWTTLPIQNLTSSSAGRLCRRSRTLPLHLLPPCQKTSFLHAAFRSNARPDGPRFHEQMACSGECSWNQAIST